MSSCPTEFIEDAGVGGCHFTENETAPFPLCCPRVVCGGGEESDRSYQDVSDSRDRGVGLLLPRY